ncbi:MAG: hypothetical protein AAFT19_06785, partial [Pseudomonadota bacterium]
MLSAYRSDLKWKVIATFDCYHISDPIPFLLARRAALRWGECRGPPALSERTEALAAKALSNAEINDTDKLIRFAHRWGVSLDWLIKGDVGPLLHDARQLREKEQAERADRVSAANDPAMAACRAWREADDACRVVADTGVDPAEELQERESAALWKLADVTATTVEGLEAQIRAS